MHPIIHLYRISKVGLGPKKLLADWAKILHADSHQCMQAKNTLISTPEFNSGH